MAKISIYSPQITVPVQPATMYQPVDTSGLENTIKQEYNAWDQKQREDATVFTGLEMAKLKQKYNQQMLEAQNNGTVSEGFTGRIQEQFEADKADLLSRAPNSYAQTALTQSMTDFSTSLQDSAMGLEAEHNTLMRIKSTTDTIETYRADLNRPNATMKEAVAAYELVNQTIENQAMPEKTRLKLQESSKQIVSSWLRAKAEYNPREVIGIIQQNKLGIMLDQDNASAILNAAQAQVKADAREARANARVAQMESAVERARSFEAARNVVEDHLASIQLGGKGTLTPEGRLQLKANLSPAQFAKFETSEADATAIYDALGDMKSIPTAQLPAFVESLKPKQTELFAEGVDLKNDIYKMAVKQADALRKQRDSDPAVAVQQAAPTVAEAWNQWNKNLEIGNDSPVLFQKALNQTDAAYKTLGIRPGNGKGLLPDMVAKRIAADLSDPDPKKAARNLDRWVERTGKKWPQVFRQVSPNLSPSLSIAATLPNEYDRAIAIAGGRLKQSDVLANNGTRPAVFDAALAADDALQDFAKSHTIPGEIRADQVEKVRTGVRALALGYMANENLTADQAVKKATTAALGDVKFASVRGRTFSVPNAAKYNIRAVETIAARMLTTIDPSKFDMDTREGNTETVRKAFNQKIRDSAFWVGTRDGTGVQLWTDRGKVTKGGRDVIYTWDQLMDEGWPKLPAAGKK
jgi:hypothetical protein